MWVYSQVSPEMMQTAQQEMTEPKCILRNYGIYPLQVSWLICDLFIGGYFLYSSFMQLAPQ
jgi:hypothetical protein